MSTGQQSDPSARKIEKLIDGVVDLHTLPIIILEADRLMRDPRTSAQQVADLLARDPALAGTHLSASSTLPTMAFNAASATSPKPSSFSDFKR